MTPRDKKHVQTLLERCDHPMSELFYYNVTYNNPWHTGGIDYLGMNAHEFMTKLARAARSKKERVWIEGTVHSGDAHVSYYFPETLVQDSYLRCAFDDGTVYHIMVDEPYTL